MPADWDVVIAAVTSSRADVTVNWGDNGVVVGYPTVDNPYLLGSVGYMEYIPVRVSDVIRQVNHDLYLPAIQREFVWGTNGVERLFDSIMTDFPIGSFLYWRLEQKNKDEWPVYEFIRDFNAEAPHNPPASMAGITQDITLVLDGQQRITSLFIGLRGSYRYLYGSSRF